MKGPLVTSTVISAVVLAIVYLFLRVLSLDKQVKSLRKRVNVEAARGAQQAGDEADVLWRKMEELDPQPPAQEEVPQAETDVLLGAMYGPTVTCANEQCFVPIAVEEDEEDGIDEVVEIKTSDREAGDLNARPPPEEAGQESPEEEEDDEFPPASEVVQSVPRKVGGVGKPSASEGLPAAPVRVVRKKKSPSA